MRDLKIRIFLLGENRACKNIVEVKFRSWNCDWFEARIVVCSVLKTLQTVLLIISFIHLAAHASQYRLNSHFSSLFHGSFKARSAAIHVWPTILASLSSFLVMVVSPPTSPFSSGESWVNSPKAFIHWIPTFLPSFKPRSLTRSSSLCSSHYRSLGRQSSFRDFEHC